MHVLVLGGGGREHALVKVLKASSKVKHVSCAPGNPGIAQEATCYLTDPSDTLAVAQLAKRLNPDVVVIGPEAPLAAGVADRLRVTGFQVFGPSKDAARLETSKVFSKDFMTKHQIPTAQYVVCKTKEEVEAACTKFQAPWVIKADGLAAGKGVRICQNEGELKKCLEDFFDKKILGAASHQVVVEEFLAGEEISVLALVAGDKYTILPVAQDYKRLQEKNKGPNTGGMGAYAPVKTKPTLIKKIESTIIEPTLKGLKADRMDYRGVLYFGIMFKGGQPWLLEYNVRFGDPEAQVILPLLSGCWGSAFLSVAQGKIPKLTWKKGAAVCVVIAADGYPDHPIKGKAVKIDTKIAKLSESQQILHASTASHRGYISNGGRVLNMVAYDKTLPVARKKAYDLIKAITFDNMQFRKDIAQLK